MSGSVGSSSSGGGVLLGSLASTSLDVLVEVAAETDLVEAEIVLATVLGNISSLTAVVATGASIGIVAVFLSSAGGI